ncbi:hypothetical protein [Lichenicola sp.]|uniref:hypothetical protein n=1 Tax=Lichenicola sp. TaxID=2804529 RepID=UPI003B009D85
MNLLANGRPAQARMRSARCALAVGASLAAVMLVAGCGGDSTPTPVFRQPNYSYLTPLRLNVGQIRIEDHVPPAMGPDDLGPTSPVPPDRALKEMAQDRLVAAGSSGTAVFSIDQASITGQPGGALDGTMAVHLDIIGNSGGHAGYAEAHVSRQFVPGSNTGDDGTRAQLYALTTQMMQDMNVEFEFQLRRTLGDWLLDASGAPISAEIEQQPLGGPGGAPTTGAAGPAPPGTGSGIGGGPASVGAPVQLAPPPESMPGQMPGAPVPAGGGQAPSPTPNLGNPSAPGPMQLSPPPGVLQAPSGALPLAPAPSYPGPVPAAPTYPAAPYPAVPVQSSYPTPPGYHPQGGPAYEPQSAYPVPPGYHPQGGEGGGDTPPGGTGY